MTPQDREIALWLIGLSVAIWLVVVGFSCAAALSEPSSDAAPYGAYRGSEGLT